ncbi:MAG TPA: hypothetical protein VNA13_03260 [Xanthomonadales bacterium]|nr:hypothetical protein [Xanthomonadales bacterium]
MSGIEQNGGGKFDPFASEFLDKRFRPPTPGIIKDIQRRAEGMLKYTVPHAVLERSFLVNGNPVIVKKHLERKQVNNAGNEVEYPFAEIIFYDKYGDRIEASYEISEDGYTYRTPGFLDGYDWQVLDDGKIGYAKDNWPRPLNTEETGDLARRLFGFMSISPPDATSNSPLIVHAINTAAETGIRATIKDELVPLRSNLNKISSNDWISIEATERDGILPGMETAVKLKLVIAQDNPESVRELTTFTLFENGTAKYTFEPIDSPIGADGATTEIDQTEVDRRNGNRKWKNSTSQWGFDRANQEHAEATHARLKDAYGKVKWHLLKP